jgi:hypothetical protein
MLAIRTMKERKVLRFLFVAILAQFPLCCGSATAGPVNSIRQNSATEALVPTTTKLLFRDPLTGDGAHLQLFRLQGEGVCESSHTRFATKFVSHVQNTIGFDWPRCRVLGVPQPNELVKRQSEPLSR